MKTIALNEKTFELIKELKNKQSISSFDKLIMNLIKEEKGMKDSMFGELKGKTKTFTKKEKEDLWKDSHRDF